MPKTRRQITFDADTVKAKENMKTILHMENPYDSKIFRDIGKHMEESNFEHRGFSVYVSRKPITFKEATKVIDNLFEKHPYLIDCFHNIQNTASNSKKSDITHISRSAHGTRDISGGSTTVYTGESFYFWFEASYVSNRYVEPDAPYYPYSQEYGTGYGGQGCPTCNILSRDPDVRNVAGPTKVLIKVSGTRAHNINKVYTTSSSICDIMLNGSVNKLYRWTSYKPIHLQKINVNQNISLSICSYDFMGHVYDTANSADGTGYKEPG